MDRYKILSYHLQVSVHDTSQEHSAAIKILNSVHTLCAKKSALEYSQVMYIALPLWNEFPKF
jgi:hypothetical protein